MIYSGRFSGQRPQYAATGGLLRPHEHVQSFDLLSSPERTPFTTMSSSPSSTFLTLLIESALLLTSPPPFELLLLLLLVGLDAVVVGGIVVDIRRGLLGIAL